MFTKKEGINKVTQTLCKANQMFTRLENKAIFKGKEGAFQVLLPERGNVTIYVSVDQIKIENIYTITYRKIKHYQFGDL